MAVQPPQSAESNAKRIPHSQPTDGTAVLELAQHPEASLLSRLLKVLGPGLITGASDDDPSGIGTYAVAGMAINFLGINPIGALFWTAVINGVLAPPLMVLIMLIANHEDVMGERKNGAWMNVLGWAATIVMFAAAIGLAITWRK